ncbi:MAG TPA: hypothetical protein VFU22_30950 [Roseiflexaceae bacterium]|nr:hypothetical protein [Roseiflexaceae bacterium]
MNPLMSVLTSLAPTHDAELVEGCQRYADLLETLLPPDQLALYAHLIQRTGAVLILEDLSPDQMAAFTPQELAVVTNIISDELAPMENRRVAALFSQRDHAAAAPNMAPQQPVL